MDSKGNEVFTIDGVDLRLVVTELKRSFSVADTENSGRTQSYKMHRDIIGTFYNYKMSIDSSRSNPADYDTFYQIISSPTESHRMVFPYNQETLEFEAYVTSGEDRLKINKNAPEGQKNRWTGLSVEFTAMEPQRRP